jgi:2-amino-4-hydroxy-6-hydroxymethyldihydropteridine diphosphokinase
VIALRFEDWEGTYREILAEFGFSAKDDEDAARLLAQTLGAPPFNPAAVWAALRGEIQGRDVIVLGAGDEAPSQLKRLPRASVLVAADGATTAALEGGRVPNLIVTDLDGNVEDEILAVRKGAYVAIHAHGDNKADVRRYVPQFDPDRVAGTCQCRPVGPLENFGGFTDGDRACFIAHGLGAGSLTLAGFDFSGRVGRYTGRFNPQTKPRKLAWSRRLIDELARDGAPVRFA